MKNIILFFALFSVINCNAQSPIVPLAQYYDPQVDNAYFKDTQDDFDQFLGEWQFATESLFYKMKLVKKPMIYSRVNKQYEDLIVGEYLFKENGVEKVNTMNLLLNSSILPFDRNIVGNSILGTNDFPSCSECDPSVVRIILMFNDPTRNITGLYGEVELRRVDENGIQKLKMILRQTGNLELENGIMPEYTSFNLPWGTYILTRP